MCVHACACACACLTKEKYLSCINIYVSQKRGREEADETMPEPTSILKEVGDVGKGLVRGVYLLKAPKLQ